MLLEPGKYVAKVGELNGQKIVVYETEAGALCAAIPCEVAEGDDAGKTIKHTATIVTRDGTIQQKTCDNLKEVFGFPILPDPFALMDNDVSAARFEIVVESEQGQDGKGEFSKVKWLNPLGGGQKMPEPANRQTVLAKYGSKFRALSGGAPAPDSTTKAAAKPAPKPPAKKPAPPPAPTGLTATMEEAWEELCRANPDLNESQATELWYGKMRELFNTDDNSRITPQQWHQLKEAVADNVLM